MKFEKLAHIILNESPQFVGDKKLRIDLNNLTENKQKLEHILKNYDKKFDDFKNYEVFYGKDNQTDVKLLYFIKDRIVEAVFRIDVIRGENFSGTIAKRKTPENQYIIGDIFWNYLPLYFDSIISDFQGNTLGKDLWKKLVMEALNKNLKVTVVHKKLSDEKISNEIPFEKEKFEEYWVSKFLPSGRFDYAGKKLFKIYFKEKIS